MAVRDGMAAVLAVAALLGSTTTTGQDKSQGAFDVATAWEKMRAEANLERVYSGYELLSEMGYALDSIDVEACRKRGGDLSKAVRTAPVSIAIRHAAVLCAEAMGDADAAAAEAELLDQVSREALAQADEGKSAKPIRVLAFQDAYTLVHRLGMQTAYQYYRDERPARHFPFVVAAWDPEDEVERHMAFDVVDSAYAMSRDDTHSGFPYQRDVLADAFLKGQLESDQVLAIDVQAIRDAGFQPSAEGKVAKLRPAAEAGGILSARAWLVACESSPFEKCGDGLVDALLPQAEKRDALPMALLAYAYAQGIGIDRNQTAADALLVAANRIWPREGATSEYVSLWLAGHEEPPSPGINALVERAMVAGNVNIRSEVLRNRIQRTEKPVLSGEEIAHLSRQDQNGLGAGYALLAAYFSKSGDDARARDSLQRAAQAGDPGAQADYGFMLAEGDGIAKDTAAAAETLSLAAHGGEERAMRYMAYLSEQAAKWRDAVFWLLPAVDRGKIQALLDVAGVMEYGRSGIQDEQKTALRVYTSLAEDDDVAEARRRLAGMAIEGRAMEKAPERAKAWLLHDAEQGDHESETMLGLHYLSGDFGKDGEAEGMRWIRKAMDARHVEAYAGYASWLTYSKKTPEARKHAIELLTQAMDLDAEVVANNLAWALCTSPQDDVRDAARGLEVTTKMGDLEAMGAPELDTVAACHAATGDFARAGELQARALEQVRKFQANLPAAPEGGDPVAIDEGYAARLALYRSQKAYIETDR
ncbi:tetratricopeptide repeat protein [Luteimonas vadosa]|uniref:Sel1 repeat family protein n=1 Tax=Luteimonas vadosa TaxID=1165507 RepID=A0ABP9DYF8_9GAMM